jgi:hypothetical protein
MLDRLCDFPVCTRPDCLPLIGQRKVKDSGRTAAHNDPGVARGGATSPPTIHPSFATQEVGCQRVRPGSPQ